MSLQLYFPKASELLLPFFTIPISAGAAKDIDQIVEWMNLDEFVRSNNFSNYYLRVSGDSMIDVGIYDGAILVVERREYAVNGDVVVAEINGEFTVKEYKQERQKLYLVPANPNYKKRQVNKKDTFNIWGVVTFVLQKPQKIIRH